MGSLQSRIMVNSNKEDLGKDLISKMLDGISIFSKYLFVHVHACMRVNSQVLNFGWVDQWCNLIEGCVSQDPDEDTHQCVLKRREKIIIDRITYR